MPLNRYSQGIHHAPASITCPVSKARAHAEEVAGTVQKSGVRFEASIRNREKGNPRFGFLHPGHAYHGYYRHAPPPDMLVHTCQKQ